MKISELMHHLFDIRDALGDLEVLTVGFDGDGWDLMENISLLQIAEDPTYRGSHAGQYHRAKPGQVYITAVTLS